MKRLVRPALGAGLLIAFAATPALASHTHVMAIGAGSIDIDRPTRDRLDGG